MMSCHALYGRFSCCFRRFSKRFAAPDLPCLCPCCISSHEHYTIHTVSQNMQLSLLFACFLSEGKTNKQTPTEGRIYCTYSTSMKNRVGYNNCRTEIQLWISISYSISEHMERVLYSTVRAFQNYVREAPLLGFKMWDDKTRRRVREK